MISEDIFNAVRSFGIGGLVLILVESYSKTNSILRVLFCKSIPFSCRVSTDMESRIGTGTPVGDPIEVDAVGKFFSPRKGSPLLIGSVSIASILTYPSRDDRKGGPNSDIFPLHLASHRKHFGRNY